jgi:hypothetical protein
VSQRARRLPTGRACRAQASALWTR